MMMVEMKRSGRRKRLTFTLHRCSSIMIPQLKALQILRRRPGVTETAQHKPLKFTEPCVCFRYRDQLKINAVMGYYVIYFDIVNM